MIGVNSQIATARQLAGQRRHRLRRARRTPCARSCPRLEKGEHDRAPVPRRGDRRPDRRPTRRRAPRSRPSSPAARPTSAGLHAGDVITELDGQARRRLRRRRRAIVSTQAARRRASTIRVDRAGQDADARRRRCGNRAARTPYAVSFAAPAASCSALLALPRARRALRARSQRDRRARRGRLRGPALTASVAPRRPRWRRHVPMLAFLLALAILIARRRRARSRPSPCRSSARRSCSSPTFAARCRPPTSQPNRLVAAQQRRQALRRRACPSSVNVGVMALQPARRACCSRRPRDRVARRRRARPARPPSGGTGDRRGDPARATRILRARAGRERQAPAGGHRPALRRRVDERRDPVAAAQAARKLQASRSTPSRSAPPQGTITVPRPGGAGRHRDAPVPPDPQSLARDRAGLGRQDASPPPTRTSLSEVYERLGSQLGHKNEKRQITAGFAGGGLALLLLGAAHVPALVRPPDLRTKATRRNP